MFTPETFHIAHQSVSQFSHSVVSNSLWPHELQHARPPCPSPTPRVHSNSCLLSQWRHLDISSSVVPFSSCPQPLQASESFPMSMTNLDSILESRDITDKGPSNQSYHFSSSCVWMWQLDHKEGWVPKNWCFWTMMLEKTREFLGLQGDPTSQS